MATDFTQDTVLHFLQSSGGSVRNADLLLHFRNFVRDHPDRERNRELFKKFINSVATVQQIDGVSHVVLRRKFKGHVPGGGEGAPAGKRSQPSAETGTRSPVPRADKPRQKPRQREGTAASPQGGAAPATALPAAGIILNNNNNNNDVEANINLKHKQQQVTPSPEAPVRPATQVLVQVPERLQVKTPRLSPGPPDQDQLAKVEPFRRGLSPPPGVTPVVGAGRHPRDTRQQEPAPEAVRVRQASPQPSPQPRRDLHLDPPHPSDSAELAPCRIRHRPSYKSAVSYDDDEDEEEEVPLRQSSAGGSGPVKTPFPDTQKSISASSPCIMDTLGPPSVSFSSSSERSIPQIHIQNAPAGPGWGLESRAGQRGPQFQCSPQSTRRSLPLEAETYSASPAQAENVPFHRDRHGEPAGVQLEPGLGLDQDHRVQLSSSHPSGSRSPKGSEWTSSLGDLQARSAGGTQVGWMEQGDSEPAVRMESTPPHHSTDRLHHSLESPGHVFPWHRSTGDLYDSSEDSASSPQLRPAAITRLNSQLRSRMCRSLGADLDQLLQDEERAGGGGGGGGNEVARLNRLHMISSSLSLPYNLSSSSLSSCSTPPRSQSCADLVEGVEGEGVEEAERTGGRKSLPPTASSSGGHQEGHSRQSQVPLESREHAWLVKGATAAWPDIYSLFREDSSLLNRRDFISGFTVLHWIAKHGDHRVLNTLWYGVEKAGLAFDVDARSTCGQTPLHIAAIHGHKNIMRLLVGKFGADLRLRDTAGKKAWQYLGRGTSADVFQLLGAPPRAALKGEGGAGRAVQNWKPDHRSSRRRRHHFSSSGERPLTAKVKRSSSLAAFLKHKSLQRFHGHQSDSSV
ncbi:uncharacterized protein V6R79_001580 [Siganus canaliculatus]